MYAFLIVVHVFVCLVLIAVILLQAGRGGGLSDMVGGQPQSILGTQTNAFMTRATEVCAVVFVITSLSLGILSTQRGKSLIERQRLLNTLKKSAPAVAETTTPNQAPPAKATPSHSGVIVPQDVATPDQKKTDTSTSQAKVPAGAQAH